MIAERIWDVVVIGAGPAGASAALRLAQQKLDVLLVDKSEFPREKICGCCLNPHGVELLKELGVREHLHSLGSPALQSLNVHYEQQQLHIPISGGFAISRRQLDLALIEAAQRAGVQFLPRTTASLSDVEIDFRRVLLKDESQSRVVRSRLVLGAEGLLPIKGKAQYLRSDINPNSFIGAGAQLAAGLPLSPAGEITMICGTAGYVGVVQVEGDTFAAAAALRTSSIKQHKSLAGAIGSLLSGTKTESTLMQQLTADSVEWRGTPALTRSPRQRAATRFFTIGDAAGFIEPFTGEGMAWALQSARLVAPLAQIGVHSWDDKLIGQWDRAYRKHILPAQRRCRLLTLSLRSPACRNSLFWMAKRSSIPQQLLLSQFYTSQYNEPNLQGSIAL